MTDSQGNTGSYNSGSYNTGDRNAGSRNSGSYNTGDRNAGSLNSGSRNSGSYNTGNYNSGNYNSGSYNSGSRNAGSRNAGSLNSGSYNTGSYNSGNYNSGVFNTTEPPRTWCFDSWVEMPFSKIRELLPSMDLKLTYMEDGALRTRSYFEAWRLWWNDNPERHSEFTNLPGFDPVVFAEITGITGGCDGKIVEIDGKKFLLTEIQETP